MRILVALVAVALAFPINTAVGQGKARGYAITPDRAVVVTREILVRQGFEVVRVDLSGATRTIWYRRGNSGRGKGKGRLEKLVIRQMDDRVVFEEAAPAVLIDIDVRLKLP